MKEGRLYDIFNRGNLELLIRKAVRKKNEVICYEEEEICLEKVYKNWRTRRKKNPDRLIRLKMSSCSIKEFNKERRRTKIKKKILKRERTEPNSRESKLICIIK
jgi:hypothetical protein